MINRIKSWFNSFLRGGEECPRCERGMRAVGEGRWQCANFECAGVYAYRGVPLEVEWNADSGANPGSVSELYLAGPGAWETTCEFDPSTGFYKTQSIHYANNSAARGSWAEGTRDE